VDGALPAKKKERAGRRTGKERGPLVKENELLCRVPRRKVVFLERSDQALLKIENEC